MIRAVRVRTVSEVEGEHHRRILDGDGAVGELRARLVLSTRVRSRVHREKRMSAHMQLSKQTSYMRAIRV